MLVLDELIDRIVRRDLQVLYIYGPRRIGKSTIVWKIVNSYRELKKNVNVEFATPSNPLNAERLAHLDLLVLDDFEDLALEESTIERIRSEVSARRITVLIASHCSPSVQAKNTATRGLMALAETYGFLEQPSKLPEAKPVTDPGAPSPQTRFGRHELLQLIGRGRFGAVWLARDEFLHRNVAIKLLKRDLAGDQIERFKREVGLFARVDHPSIVQVYDVGVHDEHPFVVMEYVPGVPLSEWANTHRQEWKENARLFAELAEGLSVLHERGLVHRDISPSNVLVTEEGRPRLIDFGIAAIERKKPGVRQETASRYSAPELGNEPAGSSADVFALGVMLHEILTTAPKSGPRLNERGGSPDIPQSLLKICLAAQSPNSAERPDASTFAAALRDALSHSNEAPYGNGIITMLDLVSWFALLGPFAVFVTFAMGGTILLSPHLLLSVLAGAFGARLSRHLKRTHSP